jgi:putative ATP-binding cassette transporter
MKANNIGAFTGFINNQVTGQILFYVLISSVLLVFSVKLNIKPSDTVSFVFTLLYLLGSIETIMVLLPGIMRAKVSSNHLLDLKRELEEANFDNPVPDTFLTKDDFGGIAIRDLRFSYKSTGSDFGIGPIDFDVRKGEVIFIYGGNGSGKTTFIHVVLGLCRQTAGEIRLNGATVNDDWYPIYRTAFAVVFSDFYLFNEIPMNVVLSKQKWDYYLQLFELEGKVTLEGRALSTTDLSAGQRKRLALIVALLEEKPVLVLDEWAADQDPYFRRQFYTAIIPLLKEQGITIIAITHDDKYYYCADKLYRMDYGKLAEERTDAYRPILAV